MKYIKIFCKIINMNWYFGKRQAIISQNIYPISSGNKTSYLGELFNVEIIKRKGAIKAKCNLSISFVSCEAGLRLCV